ncbi:MAG: HAD family phosphatase [Chloroflexi bacterium]|nr:HAD family phosphatase [Chloroflexota bacterium]
MVRSDDQAARQKWELRLGLSEHNLSQLVFGSDVGRRSMLGETTEEQVWQYIAQELNLNDETMQDLITDFWSCEQVNAELVQFAQLLRPRYKIAILSNASSGARQAMRSKFQLDAVFDPMIISAEEGVKKPDARIFHLAAERIGIAPREAIFIDDVSENVKAAQAIGMLGVQFQNTAQAIAEVKEYLGN